MAASRQDRCGTRHRRPSPEPDPCPPAPGQEVGLTPLGRQLLDALRDDPRYRDLLADPWGDHGPTP